MNQRVGSVVAVILAAGAGSRFHGPSHKLLADLNGRSVVAHAIDHAVASGIGPVIVVTGAVVVAVPMASIGPTITTVRNPRWAEGQSSSIALAIETAASMDVDHLVIGLGDQPFITADAWRVVAESSPEWPIVVASYDGVRGPHPVRLHRSVWSMLATSGDDGARTLIRDHPELVHEISCRGSAADIDTLEDVQRWKSS